MIRSRLLHTTLAIALVGLAAVIPASAQVAAVEVSITNLTRGQVISSPVVISHSADYKLFVPGMPASDELAALAEDADTLPLEGLLATLPEVFDFGIGADVIPPGATLTVVIDATGSFRNITVAAMLVSTNDAFMAINGMELSGDSTMGTARAYDSGTEGNAELCEHIPGPPCDNPFVPNDTGAEGFVHVHAGIHGIGDLAADEFDWRNPVARIVMRPAP